MDTNVLPKETNTFLPELTAAASKVFKQDNRAKANAGFGATISGVAITKTYLNRVTEEVTKQLAGPRPRSNTTQFAFERIVRNLDAELIALCLLQSGLHAAGVPNTLHIHICVVLGEALNAECFAAKLLQTDKKLAHRINKQAKERFGSVKLRQQAARKAAEAAGFTMAAWSRPMLICAGQWGVNILLNAMRDVFELTEPSRATNNQRVWTISDNGLAMADKALTEAVLKSPVYQPRVDCPVEWTHFYARVAEDDRTVGNAPLLRTGHKDIVAAAKHAIKSGQMAPAVAALNTLQSVPFKINTWIMEVITQCPAHGIRVEGLPYHSPMEVPKRLTPEAYKALSVEERTLLSKTIRGRKRANLARNADTVQYGEDMKTAARLATAERFHCPMNMDWRGRVYALTHFNFQREDRVRSMFLFANGEPIGEEGLYWLKVHVANCGAFDKVDKKPMEDRVKWVDDNIDMLTDYVKRPLYNTGWTEADSPFLFLAACRELTQAILTGPTYVCHLPVSFDGSCSGLQHLAAMTLAAEGRYVNLTDNETPEDVYQLVAEIAAQMITADLDSNEMFGKVDDDKPERKTIAPLSRLARIALDYGVDRKLVKRNVMTFAYSSKEFGMSEQHFEDTMEPLELKLLKGEVSKHPFGETTDEWRLAARYLAKRVLAAIKQVVRLPAEAMGFMQALAQKLAHEGKPLRWVSPAGIPCINRYHEATMERVSLWLNDKGVQSQVRMWVATGHEAPIAKDKAASGIAPNFVHSHDAAHLLLTVVAAANEGIRDIATVHDSFGCLPSRATRFNVIIRETFLRMYTERDVLADLLASARADLTPANHEKLPELPEKGTLDLKEIINARYAFA